jgi:2',3'-cyclic-nucleotide 2'-phosphodiesterase (5'-nucleotidase family)
MSVRLRSSERNVGNLIADAVRADAGADVAIINSGSIRGDRVYPAGPITRRTILALHPLGNVICAVRVPGSVILDALRNGVARFPAAAGAFPQVSGVTFTIDPAAALDARVTDVRVNGEPLDPGKRYVVAIPDYIFKGGDAYAMFPAGEVLITPEAGNLIVTAMAKYLSEKKEISPVVEGRIRVR